MLVKIQNSTQNNAVSISYAEFAQLVNSKFLKRFVVSMFIVFINTLAQGQSITNGNFSSQSSGWGCSPEAMHKETTYGGSNSSNRVAEVDRAAGLCQTVTGFTIGNSYQLTFDCSCRTSSCAPSVQTMDLTISGGVLSETITRNKGTFNFTQESFTFVATSTSHTITFDGTVSGTCGLILDNINLSNLGVLPVEFVSMEATNEEDHVNVTWVTAMELNNDFFTIERSVDGSSWEAIGYVTGAGNSNELLDYQFTDYRPLNGTSYYRVKQTDFDGSFDYSRIAMVRRDQTGDVMVYPTPSSDFVTVKHDNINSTSEIQLLNSQGQNVLNQCNPVIHNDQLEVNVSGLPNGVYVIYINGRTARIIRS